MTKSIRNQILILKILRVCIGLIFIGALLKILHIPYSDLLISGSFFVLGAIYIPRFLAKPKLQFLDYLKFIIVESWAFGGILGILNLPYYEPFPYIFWLSLVLWIVLDKGAYMRRFFRF